MKNISSIIVFLIIYSCSAQKGQNTTIMEKFNINEFESHQSGGEYNRTLDDGTQIKQFGDAQGYFEKAIPPNGWFYSYMEFYGNGNLKLKGQAFKKGDFQSGIWIEFDSTGGKTKEINHDSPYQLTIDRVIAILKENKIPFTVENKFNSINRTLVDSKAIWIVEWKIKEGRVERLEIDDAKGEISKQDYYLLQEDN